jgi:hypothetical protein
MSDAIYKDKYLKYKLKYLELKQEGGVGVTIGIGYTIITVGGFDTFINMNFKEGTGLKEIKKRYRNFGLTNLKSLKNINMNDILEPEKIMSLSLIKNGIKDKLFIKGTNYKLNEEISTEIKKVENINKGIILVMILAMPHLLYSDINYEKNTLINYFGINL